MRQQRNERAVQGVAGLRLQHKMEAVIALQPRDRRRRRSQHAHLRWTRALQPASYFSRDRERLLELVAAHQHIRQRAERRIVHPAAKAQFLVGEALVVVPCGVLDGVVLRKIRLQDHAAGRRAAAGASRDLRDELERSLGGAEVREAEREVGAHDPDERDAVHVVAFGDHLRADQNVELARMQLRKHAFKIVPAADGIAIEPRDARLRKHGVQQLFQPLRARPEELDVVAAALRARLRDARRESAVMAFQPLLALMQRHADGTVAAFDGGAAGATEHHRRIAAAIEQHHRLLAAPQAFREFLRQPRRDHALALAGAGLRRGCAHELGPHVHDLHFRQRTLLHALAQLDEPILLLARVVERFQRRRRRAQHNRRAGELAAHYRDVARVIARRLFLLVTRVLLFINDDECQVTHRREDGRARPHHDARFTTPNAAPLLGTLVVAQGGVQQRDFAAERLHQLRRRRRRQSDLRHQQQRGAPGDEHALHRREVHRRLARAGHTVQQRDGEPALDRARDVIERHGLCRVQLEIHRPRRQRRHMKRRRLGDNFNQPALAQRRQRAQRQRQRSGIVERHASARRPQRLKQALLIVIQWTLLRLCGGGRLARDFGISQRNEFHHPRRIARRRDVFARDPLLPHHAGEQRFARASGRAQRALAHRPVSQAVQDGVLRVLFFDRALRAARRSLLRARVQRLQPGFRDAILPRATHFGRQGQHRAEHFAERRQVVLRDPLAQFHEVRIEHRLAVEHLQHIFDREARLHARLAIVQRHHHARQAFGTKRHEHAPAHDGLTSVHAIREENVERNGQGDIAEPGHKVKLKGKRQRKKEKRQVSRFAFRGFT